MRILVVSDSHRKTGTLRDVLRKQPNVEMVLFLGDGVSDMESLRGELRPDQALVMVKGNNDWNCKEPLVREVWAGDTKILMMHGHTWQVKYGIGAALHTAKECGAKILLYGHTHIPSCDYVDGMYVMNPGALYAPLNGFPTYGLIEIVPKGIMPSIVKLYP